MKYFKPHPYLDIQPLWRWSLPTTQEKRWKQNCKSWEGFDVPDEKQMFNKIETFHSLKFISGGCVCDRTAKPLVSRSSTANVHSKRDCVRCLHWRGKNFLSTRWRIKYCSLFLECIAWCTLDYIKNVLLPRERLVSLVTCCSFIWWLFTK